PLVDRSSDRDNYCRTRSRAEGDTRSEIEAVAALRGTASAYGMPWSMLLHTGSVRSRSDRGGFLVRAILRTGFGGPDVLVSREIPEPEPKDGHAVIQVKAFGLNHAELHMRKGEWAEIADVSGIECVGVVKSCPGGEFAPGTKVAALMGGLGRTINGSYAEY